MGRSARSVDTYWKPSASWLSQFDKFKDAAFEALRQDNIGDHLDIFARSLDVGKGEISNFRNKKVPSGGGGNITHSDTTAENLIKGLCAEEPPIAESAKFDVVWSAWREQRLQLAADLSKEFAEIKSSRLEPPGGSKPDTEEREKTSPRPTPETARGATSVEGKTSGARQIAVGDLISVFAEWRNTNLAPGEGQWIQLKLSVLSSTTINRSDNSSVGVELRSLDAYVELDGGKATERERWQVTSDSGTQELRFTQWADWKDDRPTFKIDNPERKRPVKGKFDWFNFIEVKGNVGDKASIFFLTTLDGLQIEVPSAAKIKLGHVEEERLLKQWLTGRRVKKSDYFGAGYYRIAQIPLIKG